MTADVATTHKVTIAVPESVSITNYPARELIFQFAAQDIHTALDIVNGLRDELNRLAGIPPVRGSYDPIFLESRDPLDGRIVPVSSR